MADTNKPPAPPIPSSAVVNTQPPPAPKQVAAPEDAPHVDTPPAEPKKEEADGRPEVENLLRMHYILNLDHRESCVDGPRKPVLVDDEEKEETPEEKAKRVALVKQPDDFCLCTKVTIQQAAVTPDGVAGVRLVEKVLPGSITFLAREKQRVPVWVIKTNAFKAAVAAKALRVVASKK